MYEDEETIKAMSEFATIEEQLNGVEKYAVYFLEEETADFTAEQLRVAEVRMYMYTLCIMVERTPHHVVCNSFFEVHVMGSSLPGHPYIMHT